MPYVQSWEKTIENKENNATLSPVFDSTRPSSFLSTTVEPHDKIFVTPFRRLSPSVVSRKGIINNFFCRSCIAKLRADFTRGFDWSMVLYSSKLELLAWGIIVDRVSRVFHADTPKESCLELKYQRGACYDARDWWRIVSSHDPDEEGAVSAFYREAAILAHGRLEMAATIGFGFWDVFLDGFRSGVRS